MKKYDAYKDSGIDYIGKIPTNWEYYNLKYILRDRVKDGPHETPQWFEDGIPFLSIDGIVNGEISFNNCRYIDEEQYQKFSKKLLIEIDDIFIGKAASIGKIARVKTNRIFTVWSPIAVIKVKKNFSPTFVEYYFKSNVLQHQIELFSTSNTQKNIAMGDIPKMKFIAPPLDEQTQIANYLDHKTAQIDTLINNKEKLITLLKEERTAVINQAVTKGLDPTVPMKDSGIEWLGEIPEHWEVKKLKFLFSNRNSIRIPLSAEERGRMKIRKYDYYGASGVIDKVQSYLFDDENILIGEDGANLLTRSKRLAFIASGKYWVNNHAHIIQPKNGNINYYCELLELIDYTIWITGSAQPKLTQEALMNIELIEPPKEEQNEIALFINNNNLKIDILVNKLQQEIDLLKEYKTALISEVVTGKVDVRNEELN